MGRLERTASHVALFWQPLLLARLQGMSKLLTTECRSNSSAATNPARTSRCHVEDQERRFVDRIRWTK